VARRRISKFIIESFAAGLGMIQSKTSLRFALHVTQSCTGELIEDCLLMGRGTPCLPNPVHSTALRCAQSFDCRIRAGRKIEKSATED